MGMSDEFKSVNLRGRSIRYICRGEGTPAVIIDQGEGLSIERSFERSVPIGWSKVFKALRESTSIVMHDRAGLGSSDLPTGPRTSADMMCDLRSVLFAAEVSPPYVLVGHSIGGFNVRVFAGAFPNEVAGVVLIDSSHPDQFARFARILPPEASGEAPPLRMLRYGPDVALSAEAIDFRACADQARTVTSIGVKPLLVVSQSPRALCPPGIPPPIFERMRPIWAELQADLLGLSGMSTQVVAGHAGHQLQFDEPDLVVDAILSVVREAQSAVPRFH
jgi:pimeloyl-ACP methyl ester carboxylesterase